MLAKIAARNRTFPEFLKVSKKKSTKLGPQATIQAKFGWDFREYKLLAFHCHRSQQERIWLVLGQRKLCLPEFRAHRRW